MATAVSLPESGTQPPSSAVSTLLCLPSLGMEALQATLAHIAEAFPDRIVDVVSPDATPASLPSTLRFTHHAPQAASEGAWVPVSADYLNVWMAAREHRPSATLLLGHEAASVAPTTLRRLAETAVAGQDLVLPRYPVGPHDALVNAAILHPLSNALFLQPARFPLPLDVAMSARMAERLASAAQRHTAAGQGNALVWPASEATVAGYLVREVQGDPRALPQPSAEALNTVLATIAGSLFSDIEAKAAFWQRARIVTRSTALPPHEAAAHAAPDPTNLDLAPMIDEFRHAYTNMRELWSLVLPPNSLLSLKKLSLAPAADFQMSDALWARILYDFLLAYRLRTINRGHLLGALTPLYLAWVASHLRLVSGDPQRAEQHIASLVAAFHADKPYLVARWRWPDRFNP